ncbi:MarR family transcriptional regulator [Candidatus Berkiella cookevillensis]|uniref:MarR family protein n=1 Tax=Candidatus Berkiella cookevillensis TaxID=437022 RepID=A0A0Q9YH67_9GAMM|nr:MarR family transcriptional regulator [Candidatus Berkiella cookevillensis]MCS5708494.1 MarR family transcriptional regulator [Candidatus Berkiella cookevillensis]
MFLHAKFGQTKLGGNQVCVGLLKFLSENKFDLIDLIRDKPQSISELVKALHRNRAAVTRDVNTLEEYGLVKSEMVVNAGHGRVRIVMPVTKEAVTLQIRP